MSKFTGRIVTVLSFAIITPANADIQLDYAEPRVGHTIDFSPKQLTLHFTEASESEGTSIEVTDSQGRRYDNGLIKTEDNLTGAVKLKPLPPGYYTVKWHARSDDSATQGRYHFQVQQTPEKTRLIMK